MVIYTVYWKNFVRDRAVGQWPVSRWFANHRALAQVNPGDLLVMFVGGEACGDADRKAGFVVQLLQVDRG